MKVSEKDLDYNIKLLKKARVLSVRYLTLAPDVARHLIHLREKREEKVNEYLRKGIENGEL